MSATLYLSRRVIADEKTYTEAELLAASKYVVVLAEPGAGKTALMESLAQQLGTNTVTANVFSHSRSDVESCPLVIDAFDEFSKVDQTGIYKLLAKAKENNPSHVIISSRSSEWGIAATNAFKEFFGNAPIVVRLYEFNESEQEAIFNDHIHGEDFVAFQAEIARFDLEMLLPNPQFLKLFAGAYLESKRLFPNKRSIFEQAVEYLAKEANENILPTKPTLSTVQKIELSSEVFAKLLLSGAEGVGTSEASENRLYPLLASLFSSTAVADGILATQLFKPGNSPGQHRPVHKIVSEYCAASYLTKRIMDPSDSLTILSCLAIIAPNSIVRDELRGLLGWMAALGNKTIEKAAIELDPYAVLANGDPSQLEATSKCLLIKQLKEIEIKDPYFRMGDFRRRFSVAGFLDQKVLDEIRRILVANSDGDLQDLLLELLVELPGSKDLSDELRQLTLTPTGLENTRILAGRCLVNIVGYDHQSDLLHLITEATHTSIRVVFEICEAMSPETVDKAVLAAAFRACATLYPDHRKNKRPNRTIGERYFVKRFIDCLALDTIEWLLNDLTSDLACHCGKKYFLCDCKIGVSKIVGHLLDQYFKLAKPPFDAKKIWQWTKKLNFNHQSNPGQNKAVQVLQEDDDLRQSVIAHVFGKMTNADSITKIKLEKFGDLPRWFKFSS